MGTTSVTVGRIVGIVGIVGGAIVLILALLVFVGGDLYRDIPEGPLPYPEGCSAFKLPAGRCDAIVAWSREGFGLTPSEVVRVEMLGPACRGQDSCQWLGVFITRLRFVLTDGSTRERDVVCGGVGQGGSLSCSSTPRPRVGSPTMDGYRGIPPGATPLPSVDPDAETAAEPLLIDNLRVPIERTGHAEVQLGEATLPNGVLRAALFSVAVSRGNGIPDIGDGAPRSVEFGLEGLRLEIESTDSTRPAFNNLYERGWWPGVERVRVTLEFDVLRFEPGTLLFVSNIVVR